MTTRREFLRRGALWVAAAAVVEPVARKLWAFPTNPLARRRHYTASTSTIIHAVHPAQCIYLASGSDQLEVVWFEGTARVDIVRQDGTRTSVPCKVDTRGAMFTISTVVA